MKRKMSIYLYEWKDRKEGRMPLLIFGARQVGKTFAIRAFGEEAYRRVIYVNFEMDDGLVPYFEGSLRPTEIIKTIESYMNTEISVEEDLLIFDEIQQCPRAITSMKYFAEELPSLHLIGAGSLLGVAVNRSHISFPVGKVFMKHMYPMDFEEFLWAKGKVLLSDRIRKGFETRLSIPKVLHDEAMKMYYDYLLTGGMPAVVKAASANENTIAPAELQQLILDAYTSDMAKYATHTESVRIKGAYETIPMQLAKENRKFQYKLIKSGARASLFRDAIDWLISAGIGLVCYKTNQGLMPPVAYQDPSSFKLYMSDTGLLSRRLNINHISITSASLNQYLGAITENYVAISLSSRGYEIMYWASKHSAEVDFIIMKNGEVIPIEVKSSINTKAKSLNVYVEKYTPTYAIRVSPKNFGFENNIFSVPMYAVHCI